jgi:hypothetical protein
VDYLPHPFHSPSDQSTDNNLEGNRFGRKVLKAKIPHCGISEPSATRTAHGHYCLQCDTVAQGWIQWGTACCHCLICQDWDVLYGENQCTITVTFEDENLLYVRSKTKAVLIVLFDMDGLVQCEFLTEGHSMNQTAYRMGLQCLQHAVRWEMPHRLWSVT